MEYLKALRVKYNNKLSQVTTMSVLTNKRLFTVDLEYTIKKSKIDNPVVYYYKDNIFKVLENNNINCKPYWNYNNASNTFMTNIK